MKIIIKIFRGYLHRFKLGLEFKKDFYAYHALSIKTKDNRFLPLWENRYPQLYDKTTDTGFDAHYVYHPAWAARVIAKLKPRLHIDISSKLYFATMVSAFVPVDFYDYRPANLRGLSGLNSKHGDLMKLPFPNNSVESISCMHTVEHIGLGRYGDPLDPEGDLKAIEELKRVTAKGGTLIFVTPTGKQKLMYNAHRIYSYDQIMSYFKGFELKEFALIPDDADKVGIIINASKELADKQTYGCGCYWFVKK
jgi:SAM-dependent methyltransferase